MIRYRSQIWTVNALCKLALRNFLAVVSCVTIVLLFAAGIQLLLNIQRIQLRDKTSIPVDDMINDTINNTINNNTINKSDCVEERTGIVKSIFVKNRETHSLDFKKWNELRDSIGKSLDDSSSSCIFEWSIVNDKSIAVDADGAISWTDGEYQTLVGFLTIPNEKTSELDKDASESASNKFWFSHAQVSSGFEPKPRLIVILGLLLFCVVLLNLWLLIYNTFRLEGALSSQKIMFYNLAHELPAIIFSLESLIDKLPDITLREELEEKVELLKGTVSAEIDHMKDIKTGTGEFWRNVYLLYLIEDAIESIEETSDVKSGDVKIKPGGEQVLVRVNQFLSQRAFENLIKNALFHGGGSVEISLRAEGKWAVVEIADRGPGVRKDIAVWNLRTSGDPCHSGIGLCIVREFILRNRGKVALLDRKGGGTIARVILRRV